MSPFFRKKPVDNIRAEKKLDGNYEIYHGDGWIEIVASDIFEATYEEVPADGSIETIRVQGVGTGTNPDSVVWEDPMPFPDGYDAARHEAMYP